MLSKTVFSQMLVMLCEVYDKPLTKTLSSTYYFLLQDMSDEDFKQAVKCMMMERTFATLPKPAEILSYSKAEKVVEVDQSEVKAKELIGMVYTINDSIYVKSAETNTPFLELLKIASFPTMSEEDRMILENVKPHYDLKLLIEKISCYPTAKIQLDAFMDAVKNPHRAISHNVKKMLLK